MTEEELDENDITTSENARWVGTGTILSIAMVLSLPAIIILAGLGLLSLSGISQFWFTLYFLVTMMAATWVFGEDVLKAVRKTKDGG